MKIYRYSGRNMEGALKKGIVEAETEGKAIEILRSRGINPRQVDESTSIFHKNISLFDSVKNQDFVVFCRQFATLVRAGVPIVESTNILAAQTPSKPLKNALYVVELDIRSGTPFSDAANKHKKVFPPLFVNMIRAGELTGSLDETLERLAVYYEKQFTLKKKVQSTMMYPAVLLVVIVIVVIGLMLTVVPQFAAMFQDFGAELPAITVFVLALSEAIQQFWWLGLILVTSLVITFSYIYKNNPAFHYNVNVILLKMPVFGQLLQKSAIARMTRTLSSLFTSSVPILQALTIVEKVVGNPVIGKVVLESRTSLEQGGTLSEPLRKSWIFPPLVHQMTGIGEKTGSLDYMLEKIADFYEADVDRTVDTLKGLIEPLMIVILAGVVGVIVLSIMVPMFSLFEQI